MLVSLAEFQRMQAAAILADDDALAAFEVGLLDVPPRSRSHLTEAAAAARIWRWRCASCP